jgi:hypothetical protein
MEWKKEQITSFVRDARAVLVQSPHKKEILLGLFLVPWTKGEKQSAITFQLAQDAEQLSVYADVLSPMVYHRMCGQPVSWIRDISQYFREMTAKPIWPILQAEDVGTDEFVAALNAVTQSGAQSVLVFSFAEMSSGTWSLLHGFRPLDNLIPNADFVRSAAVKQFSDAILQYSSPEPDFWKSGADGILFDSEFWVWPKKDSAEQRSLGITAGQDRQGIWSTGIDACEPGKQYTFSAEFFRDNMRGRAYPEVSFWDEAFLLNTHRVSGSFQKMQLSLTCPEKDTVRENTFRFTNRFPGVTFWMRNPQLVQLSKKNRVSVVPTNTDFFPIATYGADVNNINDISKIGFNGAVVSAGEIEIDACIVTKIHCTLAVPRDLERLTVLLSKVESRIRRHKKLFSFYVNDEPGIHSFPLWKAGDIQRILKDRFPDIPTGMAIVRPQVIPDYEDSADYFMLDQYPVPFMPMTWLSDSMDEAAGYVGTHRLQSVIQAFGGEQWARDGWPRLPTFTEMNNLAFLSVIHGSRGIYFYTFPVITATEQGQSDLQMLVKRLNGLYSWLVLENDSDPVAVEMKFPNRFDPAGKEAVHCARKKGKDATMLFCANTIPTYTRASISVSQSGLEKWEDFYTGAQSFVVDATLLLDFSPLEVKILTQPSL